LGKLAFETINGNLRGKRDSDRGMRFLSRLWPVRYDALHLLLFSLYPNFRMSGYWIPQKKFRQMLNAKAAGEQDIFRVELNCASAIINKELCVAATAYASISRKKYCAGYCRSWILWARKKLE
jgi:hypothetical protein